MSLAADCLLVLHLSDSSKTTDCCRDCGLDVQAFEETGGNIIIGTPGRVSDVMKRSKLMQTKTLEVLVLDEADRLLDMGFKLQLDYIMSRLPKQRRTGESSLSSISSSCFGRTKLCRHEEAEQMLIQFTSLFSGL